MNTLDYFILDVHKLIISALNVKMFFSANNDIQNLKKILRADILDSKYAHSAV